MIAGDLLEEVSQLFAINELTQHRREALLLLADLTGSPTGGVLLHPEAEVPSDLTARVRAAARHRANGTPLAYATGRAAFRTLSLAVDARVLIPRPETEGLVEQVLAWQAGRTSGGIAVDVGTGSGCVALSLAVEGRFAHVVGIDRSPEAVAVAQLNARAISPAPAVEWLVGDLLTPVAGRGVTVIVSNPPYVTREEWEVLDPAVRDHEPRMALVAGDDGMEAIARLVTQAQACLVPGGLLAVEVDSRRPDPARLLAEQAGFTGARITDDLFGRPRYLLASKE